ncbi:MAG: AAA family ATPase [Deltaproteobacteria bacterium]|jgi:superfamily I DNA/RNA helicase|nr:AAA family ATPase [Deltaproteobacteria bacterium]
MNSTIAISAFFLDSLKNLPSNEQNLINNMVLQLRSTPLSHGLNLEEIKGAPDKKMRSLRLSDSFRAILAQFEDQYFLLMVGNHDETYKWASRYTCEINPLSDSIQIYDATYSPEISEENLSKPKLFANISDENLKLLAVPPAQLDMVRNLTDLQDFLKAEEALPIDAFEYLHMIAIGAATVKEAVEVAKDDRTPDDDELPVPGEGGALFSILPDFPKKPDIDKLIRSDATRRSFYIVEDDKELERIMNSPLEKWRVFLHPLQRKIVTKNYSGPVRILGGAGTGKTVVSIHRSKWLAKNLEGNGKILFTTFTANLAADIKELLRQICDPSEFKRIEVINLDAFVSSFLRNQGYPFTIVYDDKLKNLWEDAISLSGTSSFNESFYMDEWSKVATYNDAYTREEYLKASRVGRGTRLDRKKREEVWKVFEEFRKLLLEKKIRDIDTALYESRLIALKNQHEPYFSSIVVDEGQDLSMNAFRFLRALAGPERPNDIFITGDTHQRIYKHKVVLSKCGINVRGRRTTYLRTNYRTTEETRKFAYAILKDLSFDDMDTKLDTKIDTKVTQSLTHSDYPELCHFNGADAELDYIADKINELSKNGVKLNNICLVARTKTALAGYTSGLTKKGIMVYEIKRSRPDDHKFNGVRLATMHRVKGLEFQYVFVASANKGIIPLDIAIDYSDKVTLSETLTAEKCLLYVALTRARQKAFISSFGEPSEFLKNLQPEA